MFRQAPGTDKGPAWTRVAAMMILPPEAASIEKDLLAVWPRVWGVRAIGTKAGGAWTRLPGERALTVAAEWVRLAQTLNTRAHVMGATAKAAKDLHCFIRNGL